MFDSVDDLTLWNILKNMGVPNKLVILLFKLYDGAECCVRVNGKDSACFSVDSGIRQGCVVAPDLFNCVIDHLMTCICQQTAGVQLGKYYLIDLEYASDTIMFSKTLTDFKAWLIVFQKEVSKLGFQGSWEKTKLIHVSDGPDPPPITAGTVVKSTNSLNYQGSTVISTGSLNDEIN